MQQQPPPPASWAPPVQTGPAPGVSYAGSGQRLIAYIVDGFIMGLVILVFYFIGGLAIAAGVASSSGVVGLVGGLIILAGVIAGLLWKPY